MERGAPSPVEVWWRGIGPLPGVRSGEAVVYEMDVHPRWFTDPRPTGPVRQRVYVLPAQQVQLQQPVAWTLDREDWWYVDLIEVDDQGDCLALRDDYLDFIVGPPDRPYRIVDMDEYAEALSEGKVTAARVAEGLRAAQTFAERHLHRQPFSEPPWPDFPPADIQPLFGMRVPDPHGWAALASDLFYRARWDDQP